MRFAGSAPEREETHSKPRLRYRKFCGSLRDDRRDRNHEKNARRRRKAGPARGRKDISGCVAVASFAATSSQKQVMSLMSCSPFSPKPHVPRVCARHPSSFFSSFFVSKPITSWCVRLSETIGCGRGCGSAAAILLAPRTVGEARLCACGAPAARPGPSHCPEENDCLCKYINHHLSLIVCLV